MLHKYFYNYDDNNHAIKLMTFYSISYYCNFSKKSIPLQSYWFGLVLWHINLCRLFNAKSIFT